MSSSSLAFAVSSPEVAVELRDPDRELVRTVDLNEAATWRFERGPGVRRPASYKGQRNWVGAWWFSKSGEFVPYESWVERDWLIALDRSPDVRAVVAQPMTLHLAAGRHTPDFFVRHSDGSVEIVDVRPDDRIGDVDAAKFEQTDAACALVGWGYLRVGEMPPVELANLRWLAAYRHPWCAVVGPVGSGAVLDALGSERLPVNALADKIGCRIAAIPVVFHLMWAGVVQFHESLPFEAP